MFSQIAGAGGMPNVSSEQIQSFMKNFCSPELLNALANPELQMLKSRPAVMAGPMVPKTEKGVPLDPRWKTWRVVYPEYLDGQLTRRDGRRLAAEVCPVDIGVGDVVGALIKLDWPFVLENKRYPRRVYSDGGRVRVDFQGTKIELLTAIAVVIQTTRGFISDE